MKRGIGLRRRLNLKNSGKDAHKTNKGYHKGQMYGRMRKFARTQFSHTHRVALRSSLQEAFVSEDVSEVEFPKKWQKARKSSFDRILTWWNWD